MATPQCLRCGKTDNWTAHRLLLTCSSCRKSWHHRCHIPPVSDNELIVRIKATNPVNGLSAWRCRTCTPVEPIEIPDLDSPPRSVPIAPVIDLTTTPEKKTSVVDLTSLSDCSSDDEPRGLSNLSITEPVVTSQVRHVENNSITEWNTCHVHQSIPEIVSLGWMRCALHNRQQRGRRSHGCSHRSFAASSEKFYFNVSDLVIFIHDTPL